MRWVRWVKHVFVYLYTHATGLQTKKSPTNAFVLLINAFDLTTNVIVLTTNGAVLTLQRTSHPF